MTRPAPWLAAAQVLGKRPAKVIKPSKRPRRRTPARAREERLYAREAKAWLAGKGCAMFPYRPATEVHHVRSRRGMLLRDKRYWLPVSQQAHAWIHAHPALAQANGWLAGRGAWGKAEK